VSLSERALAFATEAHKGQKRKYTGEDYIVHPIAVAELVRTVQHTPEMIAAAYLHDTVEDCGVKLDTIEAEFGYEVRCLVWWLTEKATKADGNRRVRKRIDREHLAGAPAEAQTIKLADIIDNVSTIKERDPDFWRVYRLEKLALLDVLTRGDAGLLARARELCA
jgi:(p)ppGpp synthase/HD superfamily hydrolase